LTKEDKMFPLDIRDIRQIPKEKVIAAKIGSESDNYLMHAINKKCPDLIRFLLREVPEIDILDKNSKGMTALHLAIKSNIPSYVKLLFIKDHKNTEAVEKVCKNMKLDDIKGNIRDKAAKMLQSSNLRGMTALIQAVDHSNYDIFRFLIELCAHIQKTQPSNTVLTATINAKDDKQETALLKAVRLS